MERILLEKLARRILLVAIEGHFRPLERLLPKQLVHLLLVRRRPHQLLLVLRVVEGEPGVRQRIEEVREVASAKVVSEAFSVA